MYLTLSCRAYHDTQMADSKDATDEEDVEYEEEQENDEDEEASEEYTYEGAEDHLHS
jgi:hypothetical protein